MGYFFFFKGKGLSFDHIPWILTFIHLPTHQTLLSTFCGSGTTLGSSVKKQSLPLRHFQRAINKQMVCAEISRKTGS